MQYTGTVGSGMQKDSWNDLVFCNLLAHRNETVFPTSSSEITHLIFLQVEFECKISA